MRKAKVELQDSHVAHFAAFQAASAELDKAKQQGDAVLAEQQQTPAESSPVPPVPTVEKAKEPEVDMKQLMGMGRKLASIIGNADSTIARLQVSTQKEVADIVTDMINAGLTKDMFRKNQPIWTAITDEIMIGWACNRSTKYAAYVKHCREAESAPKDYATWAIDNSEKVEVMPESTINNRRSAIRKFIEDKIDNPATAQLDLYGNLERKAKIDNAKKQVHHVQSSQDEKDEPKKDAPAPVVEGEKQGVDAPVEQKAPKIASTQSLTVAVMQFYNSAARTPATEKYFLLAEEILKLGNADGFVRFPVSK